MNKIRKGNQVIVLAGRDKGKRGTVSRRVDDERLIVDGVNLVKKHVNPNPMKGTTGGVVDKTMPIHQSNVAIWNAAAGKADKVAVSFSESSVLESIREPGALVAGFPPRPRSEMAETIHVSVAWPYANAEIHVGNIVGSHLPADMFARYQRLRGNRVLMVSGTDSHGTPVSVRADAEHTTPLAVYER